MVSKKSKGECIKESCENKSATPKTNFYSLSKYNQAFLSHFIHSSNSSKKEKDLRRINSLLKELHVDHSFGTGQAADPSFFQDFFPEILDVPFPPPRNPKFSFIDLFAGIGGFRIAAQNLGGKCIFSSEFDSHAQDTYFHNFGEVPYGDITKPEIKKEVPNEFDCLFAGFPCQPFSIAGYQKGFEDTRGTLFYDIAEIIKKRKPRAIFLENVKNLKTHDHGNTFKVIRKTLEALGYFVCEKVMNAMEYANIPQNRERIFIVGFNQDKVSNYAGFHFPKKMELTQSIHNCIDLSQNDPRLIYTRAMSHYDELERDITDVDSIYQWRRQYVRQNKSHVCPTLTANMGTGGHNVPLIIRNHIIRKLSPRECLNFQGFPNSYEFPTTIPMSAMYKQAGNSVVVPLIQAVCKEILKVLTT